MSKKHKYNELELAIDIRDTLRDFDVNHARCSVSRLQHLLEAIGYMLTQEQIIEALRDIGRDVTIPDKGGNRFIIF